MMYQTNSRPGVKWQCHGKNRKGHLKGDDVNQYKKHYLFTTRCADEAIV